MAQSNFSANGAWQNPSLSLESVLKFLYFPIIINTSPITLYTMYTQINVMCWVLCRSYICSIILQIEREENAVLAICNVAAGFVPVY